MVKSMMILLAQLQQQTHTIHESWYKTNSFELIGRKPDRWSRPLHQAKVRACRFTVYLDVDRYDSFFFIYLFWKRKKLCFSVVLFCGFRYPTCSRFWEALSFLLLSFHHECVLNAYLLTYFCRWYLCQTKNVVNFTARHLKNTKVVANHPIRTSSRQCFLKIVVRQACEKSRWLAFKETSLTFKQTITRTHPFRCKLSDLIDLKMAIFKTIRKTKNERICYKILKCARENNEEYVSCSSALWTQQKRELRRVPILSQISLYFRPLYNVYFVCVFVWNILTESVIWCWFAEQQSVVSGDQTLSPLRNIDSASIGFPSVSLSYQHEFESQKNILRRLIKDDDDFDEPETKWVFLPNSNGHLCCVEFLRLSPYCEEIIFDMMKSK